VTAISIFQELGKVTLIPPDVVSVETSLGATLLLCPNNDPGIPTSVHIDEINVPEHLRRHGAATQAMKMLCQLADKYQFILNGGPIGWSSSNWRDKFISWIFRLGFESDHDTSLPLIHDDPQAFYVRRMPGHTKTSYPH